MRIGPPLASHCPKAGNSSGTLQGGERGLSNGQRSGTVKHGSAKLGTQATGLSELAQLERGLKADRSYCPLLLGVCGVAGSHQNPDI